MMSALDAILSRPRTVLSLMVVMVIAGIVSYVTIPKEARPDIQIPAFYISIALQGVSPEDGERLLVKPMEAELRGLSGLKEITSIATQGHASIIVEFEPEVDLDVASQKVREKVDIAKAELPTSAEEPVVNEINLSLFPTIIVALSGNVPERTLYRLARSLQDEIETVPSVLEANLAGQREELLEVVIDRLALQSYGILQQELIAAVTQNNQLVAAGDIDTGEGRFSIKVPGLFETARDVYAIPVKVSDGTVVTLGQVAEIRRTFKDATSYARFNGEPAITISVVKRIGENIIETNQAVRDAVDAATADWPSNVHVDYALDESEVIYQMLGSLQSAIMTAMALVLIIVVAALGIRSGLLVGLAIPTSFMVSFLIVEMAGLTINNMLLFGMVLTVGMLVDGAIVITEYADRKMAEGLVRGEAYRLAAKRMFWPVASSTATTLAAFLPMLFWPGVTGKFMANLPITVVVVLTASLITAMIFLPVLGSLIGKSEQADDVTLKRLAGQDSGDLGTLPGFTGAYIRLLQRLVRHPGPVLVAAFLILGGIFAGYGAFNNGVTFFVETEPQQASIYVRARGNLSAAEQLALTREVEDVVRAMDGIETIATSAGNGGRSMGFGDNGGDTPLDVIGKLLIELGPYEERRPGQEILQDIREQTAEIPGIIVEVRAQEDGPPTGKDIQVEVRSQERAKVAAAAKRVREHMEDAMTGLTDIEDDSSLPGIDWALAIDREEAGRFGADIASVGALVQLVTNGVLVSTYRPDDARDEVDIRVRLPEGERSVARLDELRLQTPNGLVPIANFVERTPQPAVDTLFRRDGKPSIVVKANAAAGVLADDKVREIRAWMDTQDWPAGVQFSFGGADEGQKESQAFLVKALLVSIFMMFLILVTQFNSFYHTALTLSTVVMSVAGVLLGMLVTGQPFSVIMTGTGIVALAGIVVNNAIVLIDTYQRLLEAGYETLDAVVRTCAQRLRPVLLTTVTTIFGLLPMALQVDVDFVNRSVDIGSISSSWWVQLATAIISGLAFATLLTLLLIPVLLAAPTVWRRSLADRRARRRGGTPDTVADPAS